MASPQVENGHVRIANEVLEHLVQAGLSGTEWALVMVVVRQTWGWSRKIAPISQSTFARALGWDVLPKCYRATLRRLVQKQVLAFVPGVGREPGAWGVNKNWEQWTMVSQDHGPTGPDNGGPTGPGGVVLQDHLTLVLQDQTLKTIKNKHTKTVKTNGHSPDLAAEIFEHWNSRPNTVKHRSLKSVMRKSIRARIQDVTSVELRLAIDRYDQVLGNPTRYWLTHRWDLDEFLSRGEGKWVERFLADDWERDLISSGRTGPKRKESVEEHNARIDKELEDDEKRRA